jgi:hypothetical protein
VRQRQWYLKFHNVISSFGFVENIMDQCIYQKISGSKICFLVLYVDDILLATNDKGLLHEVKQFLSKFFDMKDMGEAFYVIGIKIHRDRFRGILGLSQETYMNKVLERFRMKDCSPSVALIIKGDRFSLNQCPKNNLEREQMKNIPYAFTVGSLMYAQVCTRPHIAFVVGMLGRYQSNPGLDHWRSAKKVMRYLQRTKVESLFCRTRHSGSPKNNLDYGKRTDFWHLVLLRENVLFKESPPSIMVTRNPNWSSEILWLGIGYVKGKILSPLKHSA